RDVEVIDVHETAQRGRALSAFGEIRVVEKVTGYKKVKYFTHENAGYGDVHLPDMQMHTTSFWLTLRPEDFSAIQAPRATLIDALRAAGVALEIVATLALMCEPEDLNRSIEDGSHEETSTTEDPTLFLFDAQPGGVGLSRRIFQRAPELLA